MSIKHQYNGALQTLAGPARQWHLAAAVTLQAQRAGWLQVQGGRVWLTRDGGGDDHVLASGERLFLGAGQRVVVEPWTAGQPAELAWAAGDAARLPACPPRAQPHRLAGLRGLAAYLRGAAGRLAAGRLVAGR